MVGTDFGHARLDDARVLGACRAIIAEDICSILKSAVPTRFTSQVTAVFCIYFKSDFDAIPIKSEFKFLEG